ncbi:hypothetical protein RCH23_003311 [Cryobacterium sp. CAN_C3]|nr:hypothetical protein [Cryobacterium sp. CAN_C3]MEC5155908.1 hypothetical protein [Cryobacterium sp. CAN_C3]
MVSRSEPGTRRQLPAALLRVEPLDDVAPNVIAAARSFTAHRQVPA